MKETKSYGKILLISLGILFSDKLISQDKTDSLEVALKIAKKDTSKVNLLNDLASAYFTSNKEKTKKYNAEALALARELDFLRGEALAINNLGILVQKDGYYDSAIVLQFKALDIYTKINNTKGIAKAYSDICQGYWRKADYAVALDYQLKSLKLYEQINDQKGMAYSYNMIGIIYKNLKKDKEALSYYLKAVEHRKLINDEKGLGSTYQNIANVYKNRVSEDSAMHYYTQALAIHKKFKNKPSEAMVISGIGDLKVKLGKYAEAKKYYFLCLEIDKEISDANTIATTYINIGNVCTALKDYKTAEEYLLKGLKILSELGDKEGVMSAYEMLAYLYQEKNDLKNALKYNNLYFLEKDSIMSIKERNKISELQVQYDVEKKDLELAKKKAELETKEKETFIKNIIIVSVIVLLLLIVFVTVLYVRKQRIEQKLLLDTEIARQKEVRAKSIIETEERERIRIAKDLHDGVGQLLSAAKMNLSSVRDQVQLKNPEQQMAFNNAVDLLDESVKEVRTVSHNMMPNILLKMGLASAVKEFITKIQNTPNLKVNLEVVGMNDRLEQEKESILYRVIQEVISNIIKHANASELTLQLIKHEKELSIVIEDNGIGFDSSRINDFEGIGLKNIISRVEFINGKVHFDSSPGKGTTVLIDLPLV